MPISLFKLAGTLALLTVLAAAPARAAAYYDTTYRATFKPDAETLEVELDLAGNKLPSKVTLRADPERYKNFRSTDPLVIGKDEVTWQPQGKKSRLRYEFVVNHQRSANRYDAYKTDTWALFRGDKLVPSARVTAAKNLESRATLEFVLPAGWSAATPYSPSGSG